MKYKEISLKDPAYFKLFIGKRVLKSEVFKSRGDIPLFSANVFRPFGAVSKTNIADFNCDYILWGIDGNFEFNLIKKGDRFATTDHCGAIKILDKSILSEYLLNELINQVRILGYDRTLRSSLSNMEKISIKIPVDNEENFDIAEQEKLINKFFVVSEIKEQLRSELESLPKITLDLEMPTEKVLVLTVDQIFDLNRATNKSSFTKQFVNDHKGNVPVYSASHDPKEVSYGMAAENLPNIKYFNDILTWNIDGSVGKAFFRQGLFTLSEKVIPLVLQKEWEGLIDYEYVKYVLEKKSVEAGFAFTNKAGKTRIKDIEIEFPALLNDNKIIPDIKKQIDLARRYRELYAIKQQLNDEILRLYQAKITYT